MKQLISAIIHRLLYHPEPKLPEITISVITKYKY